MPRRLAAVLVLLSACAPRPSTERAPRDPGAAPRPSTAVATPPDAATCVEPLSIADATGLPADLAGEPPLWEAVYPRNGLPTQGFRLYRDGRVYRYFTGRRLGGRGAAEYATAPPAWRLHARISPAGLDTMARLIEQDVALGLYASCAQAPSPDAEPPVTYRAFQDGRVHTRVQFRGLNDLPHPMMRSEDVLVDHAVAGAVPVEQP
jgi:hypothetical protein